MSLKAYRHTSPQLGSPDDTSSRVVQAEAGWNWSICLTESGKIFGWFPFLATYETALTVRGDLEGPLPGNDEDDFQPYSESSSIPVMWGTVGSDIPLELPAIPSLSADDTWGPESVAWGDDLAIPRHASVEDHNRVVAVGAGDSFCAALKANGELWLYELKENEDPHTKTWRYVSCERHRDDGSDMPPFKLSHLSGPTVRHVSASFNSITSYSTTKAYSVKYAELSKTDPEFAIIDSPNAGLPVRKVVMGDYHTVACDHAGAAFAWGENTAGQLGRGEIGARNVGDLGKPAIIEFGRGDETTPKAKASQRYLGQLPDHQQRTTTGDFQPSFRTRRFVFDVAAGGWQSGALVVDMRDYCAGDVLPKLSSSSAETLSPPAGKDGAKSTEQGDQADGWQHDPTTGPRAWHTVHHESTETTPDDPSRALEGPPNQPRHPQGVPVRRGGLPFIRIGFAGRGAVRGGPGFNVPRP